MPLNDEEKAELARVYGALAKRGLLKTDKDAQEFGHLLRARGYVKDSSQGGIVAKPTPAAIQPPARSATGAGSRPQPAPAHYPGEGIIKGIGTAVSNTFGLGKHHGDIYNFGKGTLDVARSAYQGMDHLSNAAGEYLLGKQGGSLTPKRDTSQQHLRAAGQQLKVARRTGDTAIGAVRQTLYPQPVRKIITGHAREIPGDVAREVTQHPFNAALDAAATLGIVHGVRGGIGSLARPHSTVPRLMERPPLKPTQPLMRPMETGKATTITRPGVRPNAMPDIPAPTIQQRPLMAPAPSVRSVPPLAPPAVHAAPQIAPPAVHAAPQIAPPAVRQLPLERIPAPTAKTALPPIGSTIEATAPTGAGLMGDKAISLRGKVIAHELTGDGAEPLVRIQFQDSKGNLQQRLVNPSRQQVRTVGSLPVPGVEHVKKVLDTGNNIPTPSTPQQKEPTLEQILAYSKTQHGDPLFPEKGAKGYTSLPLNSIASAPKTFQLRDESFSETTASTIHAEGFDESKYNPIPVFKDVTGKYGAKGKYVVAGDGHSRFEGLRRLAAEGRAPAEIPVKIVTEKEAHELARTANTAAVPFKPLELAKVYARDHQAGRSLTEIARTHRTTTAKVQETLGLNHLPEYLRGMVQGGGLKPDLAATLGNWIHEHKVAPEDANQIFTKFIAKNPLTKDELATALETLTKARGKNKQLGFGELLSGGTRGAEDFASTLGRLTQARRSAANSLRDFMNMSKMAGRQGMTPGVLREIEQRQARANTEVKRLEQALALEASPNLKKALSEASSPALFAEDNATKAAKLAEAEVQEGLPAAPGLEDKHTLDMFGEPERPRSQETDYGSGGLNAQIIPGGAQFVEQDIAPRVKAIREGLRDSREGLRNLLSPPSGSEMAGQTGRILRENLASLARKKLMAQEQLKTARSEFQKMPEAKRLEFIDHMEHGRPHGVAALDNIASELRNGLDSRRARIQSLGNGKLEHFIQDYFPHIWDDPKKAGAAFGRVFGKRPLEGPKSFFQKRTIPTTKEGIALGYKPLTTNPVDLALLKMHEMDRYLMGQAVLKEMKQQGIAKFVKATEKPPEGFTKIDDRIAEVSGPLTDEGARTIRGHYYAPEAAARVINNHLSPGLQGIPLFNAYRAVGNALNMAQLGFSAFHLGFVTVDSTVSKVALGFEQMSRGEFKAGAASVGKGISLYAPLETYLKGDKVLKAYFAPTGPGAGLADIVDSLQAGGGRVKMDDFYHKGASSGFLEAFKSGNYPGALGRGIVGLIEAPTRFILENAVPRMKLGIFMDLAQDSLSKLEKQHPQGIPRDVLRKEMASVWDSVDNRLGQLVYDNLFWNKAFKDLSLASVRSVGWNLGTLRELGGGALDAITTPGRIKAGGSLLTHRTAYLASLPFTVGLLGALYNYLSTGQPPKEMRDYFYPKTGYKDANGKDVRIALPAYTKDTTPLFTAADRGGLPEVGRQATKMAINKTHPLVSLLSETLWLNRDYFGTEIYHPDDPLVQKVQEAFTHIGTSMLPFAIQYAAKQKQAGMPLALQAQSFIGITPAPSNADQTAAEQIMQDAIVKGLPQGSRTRQQFDQSQARKVLMQNARQGKDISGDLTKAVQSGQMSMTQAVKLLEEAQAPHDLTTFKRIGLQDAMKAYEAGTPKERELFLPALREKLLKAAEEGKFTPEVRKQAAHLRLFPGLTN